LLFLMAEQIVTAYIEQMNWIPFGQKTIKYYTDIFNARVVYLQHGVLQAHMPEKYSFGVHYTAKEVISTHFEKDNLCRNYGFNESNLIPAGMPRYDFMDCNVLPQRRILLAPSWRQYLAFLKEDGQWYGIPSIFQNSELYIQLNAFMNSPRLDELLEKNDYIMDLKLHPILAELYSDCFQLNHSRIQMAGDTVNEADYSVFITDFSSYRFDFVYLKRAIIYFFPDEEKWKYENSYQELDLPLDGMFGDMARTAEEAVELLACIMANGGKPEEKYAKQMDGFFLYYDDKQRDRIYEELIKIS